MNPNDAVVPIFKILSSGQIAELLGTGFFVGDERALVTAKHVFTEAQLNSGESLGFGHQPPGNTDPSLYSFETFVASPIFDIACARNIGIPIIQPLKVSARRESESRDILTYEFSSTSIEKQADGSRRVKVVPYTHKGNIMRHFTSDFPETHPTPAFETSFPALQGASGAPVVAASDHMVVGMLVANHERHLLPAQIMNITTDRDATAEEVRYFLPMGKAIAGEVIVNWLSEIGVITSV